MGYFLKVTLMLLISLAAAAVICFVSERYTVSSTIRGALAMLPMEASALYLLFKQYRSKPVPGVYIDPEIAPLLVILAWVCLPFFFLIPEMVAVWSGMYHPVRDDAWDESQMPAWWTTRVLIGVATLLISAFLTRSWTRGERWMLEQRGRIVGMSWFAYFVLMTVAICVGRAWHAK